MDAHERRALPEGWEWKRLGDVATIGAGNGAPQGEKYFIDGKYPFVRTQDVGREKGTICLGNTKDEINDLAVKEFNLKLWPAKTLLIPKSGESTFLNHRALLGKPSYVSSHLATIIPNNDLLPEYLYFWSLALDSKKLTHDINYPSLRLSEIESAKIPLPPLSTQRRIVSILEKAEETKSLRAQADELTKRLLQSVFMEMFGNPGINNKGWDKKSLGECLGIPLNSGWSPICTDEVGGFPVLSLGNLRENGLSDVITKYYQGDKPSKGFDLEIGDILISRSNTRELVGRAGMFKGVPEKVIYPDLLIRIRVNRTILNPVFFEKYLQTNSIKKILHALAHGSSGSMVKISQKNLMNLSIITPPIFLQQKFARIVEKIESMRQSQNQSKQQIEDLFSALMQSAFQGELVA